jgi:hypothetical protein
MVKYLLSKIIFIASRKFVDEQNKVPVPKEHSVEWNWLESDTILQGVYMENIKKMKYKPTY